MRFKNRFIAAMAAFVMFQGALCPAICAAAVSTEAARISQEPASTLPSHACHGQTAAVEADSVPSELPDSQGTASECSDCGDEMLFSSPAQYDSPDLHVSPVFAYRIAVRATQPQQDAADRLEDRPPPRPLFLLKNSFLI